MLNIKNVVVTKKTNGIVGTTSAVTLKPTPTITSGGATTLESLTDVVSDNETTGDTLVYNSDTRKWVAKKLDISEISGSLDGGTF